MSALPRVPRSPPADDPLVPISGPRLAEALEWVGMSVSQAGKHPGLKQQTVSYIVHGRTRRCRHSRRKLLADVVGVRDAWLGGEDVAPFADLPVGLSSPPDDHDRPERMDENFWRFLQDTGVLPPAYQLHWTQLSGQVLAAWKRDIDAGIEGAAELLEVFPGDFDGEAWPRVSTLIQRALGITWWRLRMLVPTPLPEAPANLAELSPEEVWKLALANERGMMSARISPEDADDFAKAGAAAIETLLRPWVAGEKALNYRAVSVALGWLRGGMLLDWTPNAGGHDRASEPQSS